MRLEVSFDGGEATIRIETRFPMPQEVPQSDSAEPLGRPLSDLSSLMQGLLAETLYSLLYGHTEAAPCTPSSSATLGQPTRS
mgnify:CR=1 FL=1